MDRAEIDAFWSTDDGDDDTDNENEKVMDEVVADLVAKDKLFWDASISKWRLSAKYSSELALKLHRNDRVNIGHAAYALHPARWFGLRNIDAVTYSVIRGDGNGDDDDNEETELDSMSARHAFFRVFPGAIFLHRAKEFR